MAKGAYMLTRKRNTSMSIVSFRIVVLRKERRTRIGERPATRDLGKCPLDPFSNLPVTESCRTSMARPRRSWPMPAQAVEYASK